MNLVNSPLLGATPFGTIVIRYKNEDIDSNLFDLFFFLVCSSLSCQVSRVTVLITK